MEIRLARTWALNTKLRSLDLVLSVLQLWDEDPGALWACPMDKCEYLPYSLYLELVLDRNHSWGQHTQWPYPSLAQINLKVIPSFTEKTMRKACRDPNITIQTQSLLPTKP